MRFRAREPRPLIWRGTSKSDYMAFPATVQREMGYALFLAQAGERHAAMGLTRPDMAVIEVAPQRLHLSC